MKFQELTDKQWNMIKYYLPKPYKTGRPRVDDKIVGIIKGEGFLINPYGTWTYYSAYDDIKTALSLR